MTTESVQNICEMRMLVGFLGEKHQASWWDSSFLSSSSKTFLAPIFPKSIAVAQYSGVCQAASIVHDVHIGIGRHYHLYRLPDSIERALLKCLQNHDFYENLSRFLSTKETAVNRLQELGMETVIKAEGSIIVGNYSDDKLGELLKTARSCYINAIISKYKTYPYMRCL